MKAKAISIFSLGLAAVVVVAFFGSYKKPEAQSNSNAANDPTSTTRMIRPVDLPSNFSFAGEPFPLDNFDVLERFDREMIINVYWPSVAIANMKRAGRYFPIIEPILAEHGIPQDFKYLAVAESNLKNAVSPAGARGVWQFMKGTATQYKLVVDAEVDERYNIEKSTEAACKYLKSAYKKYNSWVLAAASYNMGMGGVSNRLREQKADNYFDLHLNEETSRYVFRIAAIKEIYENKGKYGFEILDSELYPPLNDYSVLQVNYTVNDLAAFAQKYGTTYRMLKIYNPWLRKRYLKNRYKRTYKIKIPK